MKRKKIISGISYLFLLLFLYSALDKLLNWSDFEEQFRQSPILKPIAQWLIPVVPAIEILVAIALIIPPIRLMALYSSFCMMLLFAAYLIALSTYDFYIPCNCGSLLDRIPKSIHICF